MTKEEKKLFFARAVIWSMFACVLPVCFIGWRYDLFKKAGTLQLSGWGLFAIVIVFAFLFVLVKYIRAGFTEWSMLKQIINGVIKVIIPLGTVLALCIGIRANLDYFIQALSCTLLCEAMAIPINPFPEWIYNKSQGRFESAIDYVANRLNGKEKK